MIRIIDKEKFGLQVFGTKDLNRIYSFNYEIKIDDPDIKSGRYKSISEVFGVSDFQSYFLNDGRYLQLNDEHLHIVFINNLIGITTIGRISDALVDQSGYSQSRRPGHFGVTLWMDNNVIPQPKEILALLRKIKSEVYANYIDPSSKGFKYNVDFSGIERHLPHVSEICEPYLYKSRQNVQQYYIYSDHDINQLDELLEYIYKDNNANSYFITKQEYARNNTIPRLNAQEKIEYLRRLKSKRDIHVGLKDNKGTAVDALLKLYVDGQEAVSELIHGSKTITIYNANDHALVTYQITPSNSKKYIEYNSNERQTLGSITQSGIKPTIEKHPYFEIEIKDKFNKNLKSHLYVLNRNNLKQIEYGETKFYPPSMDTRGELILKPKYSKEDKSYHIYISRISANQLKIEWSNEYGIIIDDRWNNNEIRSREGFDFNRNAIFRIKVDAYKFPEEEKPKAPSASTAQSTDSFGTEQRNEFALFIKSKDGTHIPDARITVPNNSVKFIETSNQYVDYNLPNPKLDIIIVEANGFYKQRFEDVKNGDTLTLEAYKIHHIQFKNNKTSDLKGVKLKYTSNNQSEELIIKPGNLGELRIPVIANLQKPIELELINDNELSLVKKIYKVNIDQGKSSIVKLQSEGDLFSSLLSGIKALKPVHVLSIIVPVILIGGGYLTYQLFFNKPSGACTQEQIEEYKNDILLGVKSKEFTYEIHRIDSLMTNCTLGFNEDEENNINAYKDLVKKIEDCKIDSTECKDIKIEKWFTEDQKIYLNHLKSEKPKPKKIEGEVKETPKSHNGANQTKQTTVTPPNESPMSTNCTQVEKYMNEILNEIESTNFTDLDGRIDKKMKYLEDCGIEFSKAEKTKIETYKTLATRAWNCKNKQINCKLLQEMLQNQNINKKQKEEIVIIITK